MVSSYLCREPLRVPSDLSSTAARGTRTESLCPCRDIFRRIGSCNDPHPVRGTRTVNPHPHDQGPRSPCAPRGESAPMNLFKSLVDLVKPLLAQLIRDEIL